MNFEEIRDYLRIALLSAVKEESRSTVAAWLEDLKPEDDSDRLGICIAIDLLSKALLPEAYARVIELLSVPYTSSRSAFAAALERFPENLKMRSCFPLSTHSDAAAYASVLDLRTFIECYAMRSGYPVTLDDLSEAVQIFFGSRGWATLEEITPAWVGPDKIVWVQPAAELDRVVSESDRGGAATRLHDALGLWDNWDGPMVFIRYPEGVEFGRCTQPVALDAGWRRHGGCFLSAAEQDGWGRTQSRSGAEESFRERVHGPIERLSKEFTAHLLDIPSLRPRNTEAMGQEALRRFKNLREDSTE